MLLLHYIKSIDLGLGIPPCWGEALNLFAKMERINCWERLLRSDAGLFFCVQADYLSKIFISFFHFEQKHTISSIHWYILAVGAHALRKTPYLQIRICYASAVYLGRKFWFTAFFLVILILTNRFDAFNPKNASETNAIIQITLRQLEKRTSSRATDRCALRGRAGHTIILY